MDWVEVTNPDAEEGEDWWDDMTFVRNRPDETLADWIANGNPLGQVEFSAMVWTKPLHGESCPTKICVLCSTNATTVQQFAHSWQENCRMEMSYFEVEWDPTITF